MRTKEKILLAGLPRSGTTWLAKVIDSSPNVLYIHEPDSAKRIPCVPFCTEPDENLFWQQYSNQYARDIEQLALAQHCSKRPIFRKTGWPTYRWRFLVPSFTATGHRGISFGRPTLTAPLNFKICWKSIESVGRLGLLNDSPYIQRIVHLVRHPCGFISSIRRGERTRKFSSMVDLSNDMGIFFALQRTKIAQEIGLTLEEIFECSRVERLAWYWTILNSKAWRELSGSSKVTFLSYDSFCKTPQSSAQKLFLSLGLDWNKQTERFVQGSTNTSSNRYYSVSRDAISASQAWQKELSNAEKSQIEKIVRSTPEGQQFVDESGSFALPTASPVPQT